MAAALIVMFDHLGDATVAEGEQDLFAVTVFDQDVIETVYPEVENVNEAQRGSWEKNVGFYHKANKGDLGKTTNQIFYNMMNPLALEKFDTIDQARTRAQALVSRVPFKAKDYKGTE